MLSPRENQILRAIVHEYISSAQPVGSQLLMTRYGLGISPATIRNVMHALTEAGYLTQPHTSAGRVPTERAYRLFVDSAERGTPSVGEQEKVSRRLAKAKTPAEALRALAAQLSEVSGAIGVALDDHGSQYFNLANAFGQPEFQDPRVAAYLAELLDGTPEWLPKFAGRSGELALRIGQENDDFRAQAVSVVGTKVTSGGHTGYVAVIGPTRMPYRKLVSLLEFGATQLKETHG